MFLYRARKVAVGDDDGAVYVCVCRCGAAGVSAGVFPVGGDGAGVDGQGSLSGS